MIISIDDEIKILNGRKQFNSVFRHKNKKVSGKAFRSLRDRLAEKGYFTGGEKPVELPELDVKNTDWNSIQESLLELTAEIKKWSEAKPKGHYDFYQNPDTGDKIPLDSLMVATDLWALDEVMKLVPCKKEND